MPDGATIVTNAASSVKAGSSTYHEVYGIYCDGSLTFDGSGKLTITNGKAKSSNFAINATKDITVKSGAVISATAGSNSDGSSVGINADGNLTNNGTITVKAPSIGISAATITNIETITAEGVWGVVARGSLTVTSGSIKAKGSDCAVVLSQPLSGVSVAGASETDISSATQLHSASVNGYVTLTAAGTPSSSSDHWTKLTASATSITLDNENMDAETAKAKIASQTSYTPVASDTVVYAKDANGYKSMTYNGELWVTPGANPLSPDIISWLRNGITANIYVLGTISESPSSSPDSITQEQKENYIDTIMTTAVASASDIGVKGTMEVSTASNTVITTYNAENSSFDNAELNIYYFLQTACTIASNTDATATNLIKTITYGGKKYTWNGSVWINGSTKLRDQIKADFEANPTSFKDGYKLSFSGVEYTFKPAGVLPQSVKFANESVTKNYGDATFTNAAKVYSFLDKPSVSYESSNTDVATVDNNGVVTIKNVGSTVITATVAGNATHATATDTYTLTVNEKTVASKLIVKGKAYKKSIKYTWSKVDGAAKYKVYFAKCGKTCKLVKTTSSTSYTKSGLRRRTAYKAYVVAYNAQGKKLKSTPVVHVITLKGSKSNATAVSAIGSATLEAGKTASVKAKITKKSSSKTLLWKNHCAKLRYYSADSSIATVSSKGTVKAVKAGTVKIYSVSPSGAYAVTTVTVAGDK